jgi:hypothetical protein
MILLLENFHHFVKYILRKTVLLKIPFKNKKIPENNQKATKIVTIAYSMKGCLRFLTFIFRILPNMAK